MDEGTLTTKDLALFEGLPLDSAAAEIELGVRQEMSDFETRLHNELFQYSVKMYNQINATFDRIVKKLGNTEWALEIEKAMLEHSDGKHIDWSSRSTMTGEFPLVTA